MKSRLERALFRLPGANAAGQLVMANLETARAMIRRKLAEPLPPVADAAVVAEIPSVAALGTGDRVLAEIDQDGFAFAAHPADEPFFNRRAERLPKLRYHLHVVLHRGEVCVRKRFAGQDLRAGLGVRFWSRLGLPFYTEAAALLRLGDLGCAPRVRDVRFNSRTIFMDYLRGDTLQHDLARHSGELLDLDLGPDAAIDDPQRDQREADVFAAHADPSLRTSLADMIRGMNRSGVAPLDVKLGNVVVGAKTGALYWIDFERAALASFPGYAARLAEHRALVDHWFGLALSGVPVGPDGGGTNTR